MIIAMTKYLKLGIIAALALLLGSCTEADKFDPTREVLVMTGTEASPIVKFAVENTPAIYPVSVAATGKVKENHKISLKIDNSLVEKYNSENKTSYFPVPDGSVQLEKSVVKLSKGTAISEISNLMIVSDEEFVDGRIYMIPVTITDVDGSLDVLETSRTIFIRIARLYSFQALNLSNTNMYANYIFEDEDMIELGAHTVEVKFLAHKWHTGTSNLISRMLGVYDKNEKGYLYRFGEGGYAVDQLQVLKNHPTDAEVKFGSTARFQPNTWYTLSITYDGSTTRLFVNGVRDSESAGGSGMSFQRVELGMSWAGYRTSQYFDGRIAELRIWNRALSTSEIQLGLCGVDKAAEGLMAYWKFDEGQGYIFNDQVGDLDMDWSYVWRCPGESDPLTLQDYSGQVRWIFDDMNKCAN